jgi:DHA1 family multidrug resistance protein-like MFS transporter
VTRSRPRLLTWAMFLGSFAWSFVFISLPFHIQAISTVDAGATLRWTGWIVGISSLVTVLTGPAWGRLAAGGDPKSYWVAVQSLQGLGFFGMAAARTLLELFMARFVLGFMGASSTLAFIMASAEPELGEVRRQIAAVQSAMTMGQLMGPLAGAVVAGRVGFRISFMIGGLILIGSALLVHAWVPTRAARAAGAEPARTARVRDVVVAFVIVLAGSVQLFFLTSILPQILPGLGVARDNLVEMGGVLVFAAAGAASLGSLLVPRLATLGPDRLLIAALLMGSAGFMASLGLPGSVGPFTVLRFLQVLCIAPVFPLVVARVAQQASGGAIGVINSARIGASFLGPVIATTVLASASPAVLYGVIAVLGLACVPLALMRVPEPVRR